MRLFLTAGPGPDGPWHDVTVDCDDDADVGAVAAHLATLGGTPHERAFGGAAARVRDTGRRLGVVLEEAAEPRPSGPTGEVPDLFVGAHALDPRQPVAASPLRNGSLVGIGAPPALTLAEPSGVVEVRVVSGPDAGTVRRLGLGTHLVGPGPGASVRLSEPTAPSVELEVAADGTVRVVPVDADVDVRVAPPVRVRPLEGPIVVGRREDAAAPAAAGRRRRGSTASAVERPHSEVDPEADRSPLELDRLPLTTAAVWERGVPLTIGPALLEIATPTVPDASLSPSPAGATMDYNRPPRLLPPPRTTQFALPKEPEKPARQPIPVLVVLAPMVMGVAMFAITHRFYSLIFVAMSPLMMLANWWQGRRSQGVRLVEQRKQYAERLARVESAAFDALIAERAARRLAAPDPAELLLQATGPRSRLWERRPRDVDWLSVRIGTADLPSEVVVSDPARDKHQGDLSWTAPDVPVSVSLSRSGVTGVAGRDGLAQGVARGVLGQVTTWHSPADLRVILLTASPDPERWAWVRWLPHLRVGMSAGPVVSVGTDDATTARRVADLVALLDARREASEGNVVPPASILVVLDGARALRLLPGMVGLLRDGPAHGIAFLCLDDDVTLLPEECRTVVSSAYGALRVETTGQAMVEGVRADLVTDAWCERVARALAPVHDVSAAGAASTVPTTSRLLDVLRLDPATADAIVDRWRRGGRSTRATIGETADGPFTIDLVTDGPHGLVAGTTGSGKSELLQTLIGSLAAANRPDEMTFVLVDYKGGAAFKDCAHLPHTVGMVTDLDGHLTSRALESLGAELRRREHQLADAGAKDIDDYVAARTPDSPPMPRLLIVIDEFAALVSELPDFVTGLVDIARRGRSLGVHLVLATQRPAGVVSAEIKSNTNLRIALRVTDPGDSQDVLESDVAAHIEPSLPGRAYARLGHSQLVPFQSSRVGGRPPGTGPAAVSVRELSWDTLGTPSTRAAVDRDDGIETPTDLAELVRAVAAATEALAVPAQPSPWLAALPDELLLDDVDPDAASPVRGTVPPLALGLADLPSLQRQEPATWDLVRGGNLGVVGQTRSGRSSALRLVGADLARRVSPYDVHLYGIDCGNGALLPLLALPHTGAVVTRDQPDRVRRLLALIGREVARRQQLLAASGYADIAEQRAAADADDRLAYLVLALDRWEGFVAAFEQSDGGAMIEQVVALLREGLAVGLRAVVTGDRSLLVGRMGMAFEDRLVLRMPSADDFSLVGMRQRDVPSRMAAGRAFRSGEHPVEVQLALLDADASGTAQVAALQRFAAAARDQVGQVPAALRPGRVDELPALLTWRDALAMREGPAAADELLVGVGGDSLEVRHHDVDVDGPGYLVVGPQRSGRSTALLATLEDALAGGWRVTVVAPRRSPLRDLAGRPGVRAVLTADGTPDELRSALDTRGRRLLVIDDFEVLGGEHALSQVADEYLKQIRDSGDAIAVACGIDEVSGLYRGVTATLRKARTGLILSPRSSADGDVFGARLPRSVGAAVPVGRGIRVRAGAWEWVQVPEAPKD